MNKNNIHTRSGKNFYKGHIYKILQNKTYIGKIVHKNNVYEGLHDPIINFDIFNQTQQLLIKNTLIRKNSTNAESGSLLKGKLFDDNNNYMSPTHSTKNGKRYRYYVSQAQIQNRLQDLGSVSKISSGSARAGEHSLSCLSYFAVSKIITFFLLKKLSNILFKSV